MQKNKEENSRKISHEILNKHKLWLVFSDVAKGIYWLPCTLIHNGSTSSLKKTVGTQKLGPLVLEPMTEFQNLTSPKGKLCRHVNSFSHKIALEGYHSLRQELKGKGLSSFDITKASLPISNSNCIKIIIRLVIDLTRQMKEILEK